jgi:F-type H+-transporting ATPase subunit delta
MKNQSLIRRYAEGLAGALKSETEYEEVRAGVSEFGDLLERREDLRNALCRPFLAATNKERLIGEVLDRLAYRAKTRRLIELLVRHGRLELLPEIARALPEIWKEKQGVVLFEVRSAVPLGERQKAALETRLREVERSEVSCTYTVDSQVIGGLSVRKGHVIYDVSLQGQLERLKEQVRER